MIKSLRTYLVSLRSALPVTCFVAGSAVLLLLPWTIQAATPSLNGQWRGMLVAASYDPVEFIFNLQQIDDNPVRYQATLDIPAQFRANLPAASVSVNNGNIMIRLPDMQAEYYGSLIFSDDGSQVVAIDGDWSQSGEYVPLRLQPTL